LNSPSFAYRELERDIDQPVFSYLVSLSRSLRRPRKLSLNAWCELSGEGLSGRCQRFRVGLPPVPEGKRNRLLMLDVDTFLTILYVTVDEFCQTRAPRMRPGPKASLCASEVVTLSIFARWSRFASERDFYRYAQTNLHDAFPTLPSQPLQVLLCARSTVGPMPVCASLLEDELAYALVPLSTGEGSPTSSLAPLRGVAMPRR
jgi:hypothetical protein